MKVVITITWQSACSVSQNRKSSGGVGRWREMKKWWEKLKKYIVAKMEEWNFIWAFVPKWR